jgi:diaminohydroxyphosphoribosylaminopyrimidine deaminase / 5-amino-6-(5-phosphoribosylamino)uracil reductase
MNAEDDKFMQSALKLAEKGIGSVEPNPAVGCVIVKAGQVIGTGYHHKFGGPHAEINALDDCRKLGVKPEDSTMYVTLEPCCHIGKTGPCTEAIITAKVARVVVAIQDPSPHAAGKGIEQLRSAGIEVEVGSCQEQARLLNAPFFKYVTTGKCWIILKWAQSIDGMLAYKGHSRERRWISNELSRKDARKLRRRAGAVIVGIGTVLADDPLLMPEPTDDKTRLRVVLDDKLRIPLKSQLARTAKDSPVLVYTRPLAHKTQTKLADQMAQEGVEVLAYDHEKGRSNLPGLLGTLSGRGVQQVLVEGGPTVLSSFLKEGLADEICIYVAPRILASRGAACMADALASLHQAVGIQHVEIRSFGEDVRLSGYCAMDSFSKESAPNPLTNPDI